ncbi:MAG: FAD-dependent monooxygenase [Hyphomicrobiales bacterium]|nr:FAD-dependent monooxygenase [Hyphomicrobiales bacterium]
MPSQNVIIAGAGATGLTAALALAQAGCKVTVVGRHIAPPPTRTVALWGASVRMLENIGIWQEAGAFAEPLQAMRIIDATGSLFKLPPVEFRSAELGLPGFGFNITNADLVAVLLASVRADSRITLHEGLVREITLQSAAIEVECDDGTRHGAALLIGAEGSQSPSRRAAGIQQRQWQYPQVAVTAVLHHRCPHHHVSTEFHTRTGPCTLVPMLALPDVPYRSSLVWLMDPAEAARRVALPAGDFAIELENMTQSVLGAFTIEGQLGAFPMRGMLVERFGRNRTMLVGEAAHAFPPIGAQGLNLGLRDVAALVDIVSSALAGAQDCGSDAVMMNYHRARVSDVASRTLGVDVLNRSLLAPYLPVDFLRGAGLMALASIAPLRRAVMRAGLAPQALPQLMRSAAKASTVLTAPGAARNRQTFRH